MKIKSLILGGVFIDAYNQSVNLDIAGTITTRVDASNMNFVTEKCMEEVKVEQIGNIVDDSNIGFKNPQRGRIYDTNGLSPCLNCCEGGGLEPKILEPKVLGWVRDSKGNVIKRPEVEVANCVTSGKRDNTQNYVVEPNIIKEGNYHKSGHNASSIVMENHGTMTATIEPKTLRIRKLTPRECFRLMDCDDEVIDKIQEAGISNSQQYKLAGNSIVVNVLYHLFRKMFIETENEENQLTLF